MHAESIEAANRFANVVMATEAATYHSKGSRTSGRLRRANAEPPVTGFYYSATRYIEGLNLRSKILADFCDSVFDKVDMLHAPVIPIEIPRIEEMDIGAKPGYMKSIASITHNTRAINFLGLPTLSVPCGVTPNGLPTGFQLIGRPFDEKHCSAQAMPMSVRPCGATRHRKSRGHDERR